MKYTFKRFDSYIDYVLGVHGYPLLTRVAQSAGTALLAFLFLVCTAHFVLYAPRWHAAVVQADLRHIADAVTRMHHDCEIKKMRVGIHPITALAKRRIQPYDLQNITLAHPGSWKGPYLARVPVVQNHPYQLLKTHRGLFIVPGTGVTLPNGQIVGRDLEWHARTDVTALADSGGPLFYQGQPLMAEIVYGESKGRVSPTEELPAETQALNNWFIEFNEAMSFAFNDEARFQRA